jgi:hypothetical protein
MGLLAIAPMLLVILAGQPAAYARDFADDTTPASTEGLPPADDLGTTPSEIAASQTVTIPPPPPPPGPTTTPNQSQDSGSGGEQQGSTAPQLSHLMLREDQQQRNEVVVEPNGGGGEGGDGNSNDAQPNANAIPTLTPTPTPTPVASTGQGDQQAGNVQTGGDTEPRVPFAVNQAQDQDGNDQADDPADFWLNELWKPVVPEHDNPDVASSGSIGATPVSDGSAIPAAGSQQAQVQATTTPVPATSPAPAPTTAPAVAPAATALPATSPVTGGDPAPPADSAAFVSEGSIAESGSANEETPGSWLGNLAGHLFAVESAYAAEPGAPAALPQQQGPGQPGQAPTATPPPPGWPPPPPPGSRPTPIATPVPGTQPAAMLGATPSAEPSGAPAADAPATAEVNPLWAMGRAGGTNAAFEFPADYKNNRAIFGSQAGTAKAVTSSIRNVFNGAILFSPGFTFGHPIVDLVGKTALVTGVTALTDAAVPSAKQWPFLNSLQPSIARKIADGRLALPTGATQGTWELRFDSQYLIPIAKMAAKINLGFAIVEPVAQAAGVWPTNEEAETNDWAWLGRSAGRVGWIVGSVEQTVLHNYYRAAAPVLQGEAGHVLPYLAQRWPELEKLTTRVNQGVTKPSVFSRVTGPAAEAGMWTYDAIRASRNPATWFVDWIPRPAEVSPEMLQALRDTQGFLSDQLSNATTQLATRSPEVARLQAAYDQALQAAINESPDLAGDLTKLRSLHPALAQAETALGNRVVSELTALATVQRAVEAARTANPGVTSVDELAAKSPELLKTVYAYLQEVNHLPPAAQANPSIMQVLRGVYDSLRGAAPAAPPPAGPVVPANLPIPQNLLAETAQLADEVVGTALRSMPEGATTAAQELVQAEGRHIFSTISKWTTLGWAMTALAHDPPPAVRQWLGENVHPSLGLAPGSNLASAEPVSGWDALRSIEPLLGTMVVSPRLANAMNRQLAVWLDQAGTTASTRLQLPQIAAAIPQLEALAGRMTGNALTSGLLMGAINSQGADGGLQPALANFVGYSTGGLTSTAVTEALSAALSRAAIGGKAGKVAGFLPAVAGAITWALVGDAVTDRVGEAMANDPTIQKIDQVRLRPDAASVSELFWSSELNSISEMGRGFGDFAGRALDPAMHVEGFWNSLRGMYAAAAGDEALAAEVAARDEEMYAMVSDEASAGMAEDRARAERAREQILAAVPTNDDEALIRLAYNVGDWLDAKENVLLAWRRENGPQFVAYDPDAPTMAEAEARLAAAEGRMSQDLAVLWAPPGEGGPVLAGQPPAGQPGH